MKALHHAAPFMLYRADVGSECHFGAGDDVDSGGQPCQNIAAFAERDFCGEAAVDGMYGRFDNFVAIDDEVAAFAAEREMAVACVYGIDAICIAVFEDYVETLVAGIAYGVNTEWATVTVEAVSASSSAVVVITNAEPSGLSSYVVSAGTCIVA